MPPVLVREAVAVHPPIHVRAIIRPEPAPERQVVGPVHDVHAVELERARPLEMADEGLPVDRRRPPRSCETLPVQPQPDHRGPREPDGAGARRHPRVRFRIHAKVGSRAYEASGNSGCPHPGMITPLGWQAVVGRARRILHSQRSDEERDIAKVWGLIYVS